MPRLANTPASNVRGMRGIRRLLAALSLIFGISAVPAGADPSFSWQAGTWQPDAVAALASDGTKVWAIGPGGFRRYDATTGTQEAKYFYDPTAAEWQLDHRGWQPMWGYESSTYDPVSGSLWLISRQDRVLMQVNGDTADILKTFYDSSYRVSSYWHSAKPYGSPMGVPWVVKAAFGFIWVLDTDGLLHQIDPATGQELRSRLLPVKRGAGRVALISDGRQLWASAMDSSWLGSINPTTLDVLEVVPGPPPGPWYATNDELRYPVSIAVDSIGHIWVSEYEGRIRTYDSAGNLLNTIDSPLMEPLLSTNGSVVWAVTSYPPSSTSPGDPVMLSIDSASMTVKATRTPTDMDYPGFHAVTDVLYTGSSLWFAAFNNAYRESRVGKFTPPNPPGLPRNIVVHPSASGELAVSWDAPATDGGSPITGYQVDVTDNGGIQWTRCSPGSSGSPAVMTATCGGLVNLRSHLVRVVATNQAGTGPAAQSNAVWPVPSLGLNIFAVERLTDTSSVVTAVVSGATPGASLSASLSTVGLPGLIRTSANPSGQAQVSVTTKARLPLGGWGTWVVRQGGVTVRNAARVAVPSVAVFVPMRPRADALVRMNRHLPTAVPAEQPAISILRPSQGCAVTGTPVINPSNGTAVFHISHPLHQPWQCDLELAQRLNSGESWSRNLSLSSP